MRHIVRREGQRRQSRFMPCPRQFGRWLWGVTEIECISLARLANASGPPLHLQKSLLEIAAKALTGSGNFAPLASRSSPRQGGQGFDRAVKFPSVSIRRWPDGGPCLHEHTTTAFDPKGCSPSRKRTAWRDFSIGRVHARDDSERWSQGDPKQSPPAGWYGCLEALFMPRLYWVRRSRA